MSNRPILPTKLTRFRCPDCGASGVAELRSLVDSEGDPAGRAAIMNRTLWHHPCPACGIVVDVDHDVTYHNPHRRFIVHYTARFEAPDLPDVRGNVDGEATPYTLRLAFYRDELADKIGQFEPTEPFFRHLVPDERLGELILAHFYVHDRQKQIPTDARMFEWARENWQTRPTFVYRCVTPDGQVTFARYSIERVHRAMLVYEGRVQELTDRFAENRLGWLTIDRLWARQAVRACHRERLK